MKRMILTVFAVGCILAIAGPDAVAALSDPLEILQRSYDAIGGIDKMNAQKTAHMEATLELEGTGISGTIERWSEGPVKNRTFVDLGILTQTTGDDGHFRWTVDQNGKLLVHKDETSVNERKVDSLTAEFALLDPDSKIFTLRYDGIDTAAGHDCYVVTITNTLNTDTTSRFIDTATFITHMVRTIRPQSVSYSYQSDYRDVDGVLLPFHNREESQPVGMVQVVDVKKIDVNVPVDDTLFMPPSGDVQDFTFTSGWKAENIPFRLIENHIYLPVTVGGKERLWVLDSGAGITVVEARFADELGLPSEGDMKGSGAGNVVNYSFTELPGLDMQGIHFEAQKAARFDLYSLFHNRIGLDVAGILGYDFLSRFVTRIDYANELISFYMPDSFSYSGPGTIVDAPVTQEGSFHVPLVIDDSLTGPWHVDLGAGNMSFHFPYADLHHLLDRKGVDKVGYGAGGPVPDRRIPFHTVEFAGFVWHNPLIDVPLQKGEGAFSATDLTGNIGNALLKNFVITLDYKRGQVIVEKGDNFDKPQPHDMSGLQLENTADDRKAVSFVADNTPASKAGVRKGDVILAVNGIDVALFDGLVALRKVFMGEAGTQLTLTLEREGKPMKADLTLRELYRP